MSHRFILLCEDEAQERLARAYLEKCKLRNLNRLVRFRVASRLQKGGGVHWVLNAFPDELQACRKRHARTVLIVMLDADSFTVEQRQRELLQQLKVKGYDEITQSEPVVLLIPKRNVETWIASLLGRSVDEDGDYKSGKRADKEEYRNAAEKLFEWSRLNAEIGPTCVESLKAALSEWRKIDEFIRP